MLKSLLVAVACVVLAASARAQDWPTKPVRLIAPFPPGGSVDQVARVLANYLTPALGQQVLVDNRGGAAGSIGTGIAAKSAPDGYTFVVVFDTHAVNPSVIPNIGFDTVRDLAPVMLIGTSPMIVTAHASTPYQSFADVVNAAKAKPEAIGFGTIGTGSLGHLAMTLLQNQGGFKLTHVPYKGGGPLMQDAVAGHVPLAIGTAFLVNPHVQSKSIRALAVTSGKRTAQSPDVPTVAEQGFKGFEAYAWWGILAPARTPQPVLDRMHAELGKMLKVPAARERLTQQGMDIVASSPAEFGKFLNAEIERWGKVVRDNAIRAGE
jgi:tripartite-type tricarboxylate transporter receptor subunit TctC